MDFSKEEKEIMLRALSVFIMDVEKTENEHDDDETWGPLDFQEVSDSVNTARKLIKKFEEVN
jgi:hypothetical protein